MKDKAQANKHKKEIWRKGGMCREKTTTNILREIRHCIHKTEKGYLKFFSEEKKSAWKL